MYSSADGRVSVHVQSGAVVVAEVLRVVGHPSADRLRVCTLDVGAADPVSVVTSATEAAEGRRVIVAVSGMAEHVLRCAVVSCGCWVEHMNFQTDTALPAGRSCRAARLQGRASMSRWLP